MPMALGPDGDFIEFNAAQTKTEKISGHGKSDAVQGQETEAGDAEPASDTEADAGQNQETENKSEDAKVEASGNKSPDNSHFVSPKAVEKQACVQEILGDISDSSFQSSQASEDVDVLGIIEAEGTVVKDDFDFAKEVCSDSSEVVEGGGIKPRYIIHFSIHLVMFNS